MAAYAAGALIGGGNATLDAVWRLARYTVHAASLDTYSDSNTRERRPYEADGVIAATARLLVQRDVLWARHSHAWVLQNPTWPVEWKQISPFLGYQDFMWTGQPDLALAFAPQSWRGVGISARRHAGPQPASPRWRRPCRQARAREACARAHGPRRPAV